MWRKGERMRKGHGGQMSAANSVYQIPHAMARHEGGGDVPSSNIRTAPTPSEPNTPAAVAAVDGASAVPIPGPAAFHVSGGGGVGGISTIGQPVDTNENEEVREPEGEKTTSSEEIPQAEPVFPRNDSETGVSTPSTTEKDAPDPEPVDEEEHTPPSVEHPGEVDKVVETMAEAKVTEIMVKDTTSPAPSSPVASPESPHKFMESPPPMEDSVGGGGDEDSTAEEIDIDGVSDQSEDEMVETSSKTRAKKKQPEAVAT